MMDPSKLKVTELRAELNKRGITPKGLKADLIQQLEKALQEQPNDEEKSTDDAKMTSVEEEQVNENNDTTSMELTADDIAVKTNQINKETTDASSSPAQEKTMQATESVSDRPSVPSKETTESSAPTSAPEVAQHADTVRFCDE
jgi:hypothetical protein